MICHDATPFINQQWYWFWHLCTNWGYLLRCFFPRKLLIKRMKDNMVCSKMSAHRDPLNVSGFMQYCPSKTADVVKTKQSHRTSTSVDLLPSPEKTDCLGITFKGILDGNLFWNKIHIFWTQLHQLVDFYIKLMYCKLNCNGQRSRNVVKTEHLSKKADEKRMPATICVKSSWNRNDYNEFWSLPLGMCEWIRNLELPVGDARIHTKLLNCLKPFISFTHSAEKARKGK